MVSTQNDVDKGTCAEHRGMGGPRTESAKIFWESGSAFFRVGWQMTRRLLVREVEFTSAEMSVERLDEGTTSRWSFRGRRDV